MYINIYSQYSEKASSKDYLLESAYQSFHTWRIYFLDSTMNLNCALNMVSPQNLQQWVYTAKILLNIVYIKLSVNVKIES